jgi:hypothetical protein
MHADSSQHGTPCHAVKTGDLGESIPADFARQQHIIDHLCQDRSGFPVLIVFAHDNCLKPDIVGAKAKGQFHMICGIEGSHALSSELATQIVTPLGYLKISQSEGDKGMVIDSS